MNSQVFLSPRLPLSLGPALPRRISLYYSQKQRGGAGENSVPHVFLLRWSTVRPEVPNRGQRKRSMPSALSPHQTLELLQRFFVDTLIFQ